MPLPFRADQIGSLLRPAYLAEALCAISGPGIQLYAPNSDPDPALVEKAKQAEEKAIVDVLAEQIKRGITPITSGEFERASFVSGFWEALEGIEIQFVDRSRFRTGHPVLKPLFRMEVLGREQPIATGKVRWKRSAYLSEFERVKRETPESLWGDIKIAIPSAFWAHATLKDGEAYSKDAYADVEEYLTDLGEAVRKEILALYEAGVRFVQIDDPMYSMMVDEEYLEAQKAEGYDLEALLKPAIFANNASIRDLPNDLTVALHLCRGNFPRGAKAAVGGYQELAKTLFTELNFKRFALEYDDREVVGDFSPLQYLPPDKMVVLGVVTTKDSEMEDLDTLKSQVFEAADIIAKGQGRTREQVLKDNIAVSPSCGFSSVPPIRGNGMTEEIQWQKLELVKKLVEELWGPS